MTSLVLDVENVTGSYSLIYWSIHSVTQAIILTSAHIKRRRMTDSFPLNTIRTRDASRPGGARAYNNWSPHFPGWVETLNIMESLVPAPRTPPRILHVGARNTNGLRQEPATFKIRIYYPVFLFLLFSQSSINIWADLHKVKTVIIVIYVPADVLLCPLLQPPCHQDALFFFFFLWEN